MSEDPHDQRAASWSEKAIDYEGMFVPFSDRVAEAAFDRMEFKPGQRFLDVAAGTGAVALRAAAQGCRVVAVDFSEGMLEILRDKLTRTRVQNVEVRVMNGEALDFGDAEFDAAGSNLGVVFFPNPERGLAEMRRVLRPGGRVFATSLLEPSRSPLMQIVIRALVSAAPDFRPSAPSGRVRLSSVDEMQRALEGAGFGCVRVDTVPVSWIISDPADFWDRWALDAPPVAAMMAAVGPSTRKAARDRFIELVDTDDDGSATFQNDVIIGTAEKCE